MDYALEEDMDFEGFRTSSSFGKYKCFKTLLCLNSSNKTQFQLSGVHAFQIPKLSNRPWLS